MCVFRGWLFPPPVEIPSKNDEGMREGVEQLCHSDTCVRMCFYRLGEVARDNGCFGAIIKSKLHRAYCCTGQLWGSVRGDTNGVQEVCFL